MIAFVVLLALVCCQSTEADDSYSAVPKYLPLRFVADPLLEQVSSSLENLESREAAQLSKLKVLSKEANLNTAVGNRFFDVILPAYNLHQKQQNQRISDLEDRIAEIQALRARAQALQADATAINDQINGQVYADRKKCMYDINDLQNIQLEQNSQISETQQRADDVNDRIDALFGKAWDNTRALQILDNRRKKVTQEVNGQRTGAVSTVDVSPSSEEESSVTVSYPQTLGAPQWAQHSIIGFHVVRGKSSSYGRGYPSIYFGTYATIDNTETTVTGVDMGSGGWTAFVIQVRVANVYFSTGELPKQPSVNNKSTN